MSKTISVAEALDLQCSEIGELLANLNDKMYLLDEAIDNGPELDDETDRAYRMFLKVKDLVEIAHELYPYEP